MLIVSLLNTVSSSQIQTFGTLENEQDIWLRMSSRFKSIPSINEKMKNYMVHRKLTQWKGEVAIVMMALII